MSSLRPQTSLDLRYIGDWTGPRQAELLVPSTRRFRLPNWQCSIPRLHSQYCDRGRRPIGSCQSSTRQELWKLWRSGADPGFTCMRVFSLSVLLSSFSRDPVSPKGGHRDFAPTPSKSTRNRRPLSCSRLPHSLLLCQVALTQLCFAHGRTLF